MSYRKFLTPGLLVLAIAAGSALLLSGLLTSQAVQNPTISLDMDRVGNSYDDTTNTMTVGSTESCLESPVANPATHIHGAHLVIRNVEDLVGWQARMNYIGDRMRPSTWSPFPFLDNNTGQNVSFVNLPIDQLTGVHRDVVFAADIPPGAPGPQSALIGSVYQGAQDFPISPDTPHKATPDDTSYNAPSGGVVANVNFQVVGDESGQSLFIDLDDNSPNAPGSSVVVFDGSGTQTIDLAPSALGDGTHGEGAACGQPPTPPPLAVCRTATPLPTPANPTARDIGISSTAGFLNDTGQAVSDLHICFSQPYSSAEVLQNAPGCPAPTMTRDDGFSMNFRLDLDWGTPCFDPGESVNLRFNWFCGDQFAPCNTPAIECFQWTLTGSPIGPCTPPSSTPTPSPSPTPTATAAPVAGHDARLTKIGGVPKNVRLSPGEVIADNASVVVANDGNHTETIGVYVDVLAPAGCTPNGRVLQTTVTLGAGNKTTLPVPVSYSCSDVNAANGQSYSWTAVADHGANDLAGCGPGSLQTLMCFNVLADDDAQPADNRVSRTGPRVVAQ